MAGPAVRGPGACALSGGHAHGLYVHADTRVHELPPECKVAAALLGAFAIVSTPREETWAFLLHAVLVASILVYAHVSFAHVARRLLFEVPFVVFVALLPFVGSGPSTDVLGVALRTDGLWAAWNILAKATLVLVTMILLVATTSSAGILRGFERLRAPRIMVGIAGFMVRYADVVTGEMRRMGIARSSRGGDARWFWQARAVAGTAGSLFVRSYERGERVYLAMVSRGYAGALPTAERTSAGPRPWLAALAFPTTAAAICAAAWMFR